MSAELNATLMNHVSRCESTGVTVKYNPSMVEIPSLDDLSPDQYYEIRRRQVTDFKLAQRPNPYPHKFNVSRSIPEYIKVYNPEQMIPAGTKLDGTVESLAGRIVGIRNISPQLRFYDLQGEGKKVLIMANAQQNPEGRNEFFAAHIVFHLGDIVGITGTPARTKNGELCILV